MEKEQYLVSICIPTYNRAPYLKKCLDSLVCQPEFQQGLVEIVVSDNASTDDTEKVVHNYQTQHSNIKFYKNTKNLGFQNLGIVIAHAKGILRKLGNDTLIYERGALHLFCEVAKRYYLDKPILYFGNGTSSIQREAVFTSADDFLKYASFYVTWIATFALWDEDCSGIEESALHSNSDLWHLECMCRLLGKKQRIAVYPQRFVQVQPVSPKNVSYGIFRVFYMNYLGMMQSLAQKEVISDACYDFLKKDLLIKFFPYWCIAWEFRDRTFIFSSSENLKGLVWNAYQNEPYFSLFRKEYLKKKIKFKIKRIPILGEFVMQTKRLLMR